MNKREIYKLIVIVLVTIVAGIIIAVVAFNLKYKNKKFEFNETKPEEQKIQANMIYYLDNNKVENMPNSGYTYVSSNCNNGAKIIFNEGSWTFNIENLKDENTECSIYFKNDLKTRTLYLDYNGGKGDIQSKQVQVGFSYGTLPTPTYENHHFVGWFTEKTGGKQIWNSEMPDNDVTIYAHWEEEILLMDKLKELIKTSDDIVKVGNDYRFVGKNPNNFVYIPGFGTCRILGIINGDIKVIAYYNNGTLKDWNIKMKDNNDWDKSDFYDYLNNEYYNGMDSLFKKIVKKQKWNIGKVSYEETAKSAYDKESKKTIEANIGLMSVSDYGYAFDDKCWEDDIMDAEIKCNNKNWLYKEKDKYGVWTLTGYEDNEKEAIYFNRSLQHDKTTTMKNFKISFYLNEKVKITNATTGDGSNEYNKSYQLSMN